MADKHKIERAPEGDVAKLDRNIAEDAAADVKDIKDVDVAETAPAPKAKPADKDRLDDELPVDPEVTAVLEGQVQFVSASSHIPATTAVVPNTQRDAEAIAAENGVLSRPAAEAVDAPRQTGDVRGAYELAKLLEAHPAWVNELMNLDQLERNAGVKNPAPWVKHPQDLLEEAKRYNFYFIDAAGNQIRR